MASLKDMFDYQKFSGSSRLEEMIRETESRYPRRLSLDELEFVNAAGVPDMLRKKDDENPIK